MTEHIATSLVILIYKIASLFVGFLFAYLGYRLYMSGVIQPVGPIDIHKDSTLIKIGKSAPGIFFCLFGAALVWKSLDVGLTIPFPASATPVHNVLPAKPPF